MRPHRKFGADSTADEVLAGSDLTGKLALVTGGSSGLGVETARALAAHGARVVVTARSEAKAAAVLSGSCAGGAALEAEVLELGSFASIRAFADRFLAQHSRLDILINNAGIMACPKGLTEDGVELQFGTNHLGHFLLTNLLAPIWAPGMRVVSLSSFAHQISPVVFEDIHFDKREYERWVAYGQSKTANALFAVALNRRLQAPGGVGGEAFSVHPGAIRTGLSRFQSERDVARSREMEKQGKVSFKSVPAGAATSVYAATAPELQGHGGAYLADCAIARVSADASGFSVARPHAVDPTMAEQLWSVSEALVAQR